MSIRIALDNPPEFYTNLDLLRGRVVLTLTRPEQVGAIVVKLEGESKTALAIPTADDSAPPGGPSRPGAGTLVQENHKILYRVSQVFPDETVPAHAVPVMLTAGQHSYPFRFKIPFNNACSDPTAMAKIGGLAGAGGFASGPALFGLGGIRVMDGSKQLLYAHVTKTLPPSFTGFPRQAEIRYYVKVTVQRPGLFKENWRYDIGLKFMPIEPPRPSATDQEAFARRPFTFRPRSPAPQQLLTPAAAGKKRASFFGGRRSSSTTSFGAAEGLAAATATASAAAAGGSQQKQQQPATAAAAPSIEMSARLPHPSILTCLQPIPLRLVSRKLVPCAADVFLISLQLDLIGTTNVRCQELVNTETTRWVILSRHELSLPVSRAADAVGTEMVLPDTLWRGVLLPNTVMPSFVTCNLSRSYQLEVKLGLSWGLPDGGSSAASASSSSFFFGSSSKGKAVAEVPQAVHLPLHFSSVEVFSGLTPPPALVDAVRRHRQQQQQQRPGQQRPGQGSSTAQQRPPQLPPRRPSEPQQQIQTHDPLYPPQLAPGQDVPPYDDAPPSYDEAMAEEMAGPVVPDGTARPAYSGVTNENGPSTIPEKS